MQYETQEFRAEAKFQRVSPQKAKLVLDMIKGRRVEEALQTVAFAKKRVAPLVEKVLRSALDNANYLSEERGLELDVDNLYVKTAVANEGPRLKRIRPAPMGRAFRYQRRISMILITVAEKKRPELAHTVGAEPAAGTKKKPRAAAKTAKKQPAKTAAAKKKSAAKKTAGRKRRSRNCNGKQEGSPWVRKSNLTGYGWESTSLGNRAGLSSGDTIACWWKTCCCGASSRTN